MSVTVPQGDIAAHATTIGQANALVAEGADRDRLWDAHVAVLPRFAAYPEKAGRIIPMVRLRPDA